MLCLDFTIRSRVATLTPRLHSFLQRWRCPWTYDDWKGHLEPKSQISNQKKQEIPRVTEANRAVLPHLLIYLLAGRRLLGGFRPQSLVGHAAL